MSDSKNIDEYKQLIGRLITINSLATRVLPRSAYGSLGNGTFQGLRNLYEAFGYPDLITPKMYCERADRQSLAFAITNRPVNASWKGGFDIGTESADETPFQKSFWELYKKFTLHLTLKKADYEAGLGYYSVLFFGLDDVKDTGDLLSPVKEGKRKLLYLKAFSEFDAQILSFESNPKSPRYGKPLMYELKNTPPIGKNEIAFSINVHWSRVIHIATDATPQDVYGKPRLKAVWNDLLDIEKVKGGGSEMFWRGARPGFQALTDKEFTVTEDFLAGLKTQVDEYENNLRRIFAMQGVKLESLGQQIADPEMHMKGNLEMISAATGIPKRILVGSERGELASSQDQATWVDLLESRRSEFIEPCIINPFIEKSIRLGILETPETEYWTVEWKPLSTPSEKEKAEVAEIKTRTLATYADSFNLPSFLPDKIFFTDIMGMTDEKYSEVIDTTSSELIQGIGDETIPETDSDIDLENTRESTDE